MKDIAFIIDKEELLDKLSELDEIMDEEREIVSDTIAHAFREEKVENGEKIEEYTAFDEDGNKLFEFEVYVDRNELGFSSFEAPDEY